MPSSWDFDLLIVGSGPSGAHAAQEAVASGCKVGLLDIGHTEERFDKLIPAKPFSEIRRTDPAQSVYFLGDDPEAAFRSQARAGAHLTPARQHMIRDMDELFPLKSRTFLPLQSSGLGGLGIGWGANCFALEDFELEQIGLPPVEMKDFYAAAAREIGVSGPADDILSPLIANLDRSALLPPLHLDSNAENLLKRYQARKASFLDGGFYLGQSLLAMLSQPLDSREANSYRDMDFWGDVGRSVYRPRYTLEKLRGAPNFVHLGGRLALRFEELGGGVQLSSRNLATNSPESFTARKLILGAGAINSGKLALASLGAYDARLPILCNANHWIAAINLRMLGRPARDARHSLSQLTALLKVEARDRVYISAQFYSYRSLLLSRMLKSIPCPPSLGLLFLRLTATAFTCVNVHFPDWPSSRRWMSLNRDGSIQAECAWEADEIGWMNRQERRLLKHLLALRCLPLGIAKPEHGASIHYAGTLPYSETGRPLTTDAAGRLNGFQSVFVADASTWRFLPAKGLTLTLMANARRIAQQAVRELHNEGSENG